MPTQQASAPSLRRALSLPHAVIIGVGSMLGAGVFTVFGHAAAEAGGALLIALALAAFVAFTNATSSAQLAAVYPTSGGSYIFGREQLGPWRGFLAGWGFLIGKTASTAAMALTAAVYLVPGDSVGWPQRLAAAGIVVIIATINYRGVQRTATATAVIVAIVVAVLALAIISGFTVPSTETALADQLTPLLPETGVFGVIQAAGLFFFAFAGFARIATMGEEVTEPAKNIPRAILLALGTVFVLYVLISLMLLYTVGLEDLSGSPAPLAAAAGVIADQATGLSWLPALIAPVAGLAACGALLALMTGIGRTTLAMARHHDLPKTLAAIHPKFGVPHRAELLLAAIIVVLVLTVDLREAIGFSSFGVLLYYFIANWSALTQSGDQRRYPKLLQAAGMIACVVIAFFQPLPAVLGGIVVFGLGFGYRFWRQRRSVSSAT